MYFYLFLLVLFLNNYKCQQNASGFYGTAELVRQNPRRSRLLSDFVDPLPEEARSSSPHPIPIPLSSSPQTTSQPSSPRALSEPSTQAAYPTSIPLVSDIPVKPTIDTLRKYGRIFKMDTKYLTPQQRALLERIVDRVARLGGNLELSDNITPVNKTQPEESVENENEGRARTRNNRKKSGKKSGTQPPKSSESTDPPSSETETSAASTVPITGTTTSVKAMKRTTAGVIAHPTKTIAASATKVGKSKVTQTHNLTQLKSNSTNMELGNITTTSIVDSLSKDNARENVYNRRPEKPVTTTIANPNQNNNNNNNNNSNKVSTAKIKLF